MCLRLLVFSLIAVSLFGVSCRPESSGAITIANSDKFSGLDTLSTTSPDSAADRIRNLIFNSLVKKNDKFEYVGELAKEIKIDDAALSITFTLQDNVKFQNGKTVTSADAKYTLDALFAAGGYKGASFYDSKPNPDNPKVPLKEPHILAVETPDAKTLVVKVRRIALINQTLSNLVAIPIIPEGTIEQQKTSPVGSGAFKFVKFDQLNNLVELEAFSEYWEGAPQIQKLNVKTVTDANALQAELQSGNVDIAPNPSNFSAETFDSLGKSPNLQVIQSDGSNIRYIGINVSQKPLDNVKLRQAIAYGIDRDKIIKELLGGQARAAESILPLGSWAFSQSNKYGFDLKKAKQLAQESGYKGEPIKFKIAAGNNAVKQYSEVIQNSLKDAGINVEVETLENNTLLEQLRLGQFQMNTSIWIGGNQDPIFLKDLFDSNETPEKKSGGRNRSRYANLEFDKIVEEAVNTVDKAKAKDLYAKAQEIVSRELPLLPLWYPSNMVVASKRLGNISINASGDWSFVKTVSVTQ